MNASPDSTTGDPAAGSSRTPSSAWVLPGAARPHDPATVGWALAHHLADTGVPTTLVRGRGGTAPVTANLRWHGLGDTADLDTPEVPPLQAWLATRLAGEPRPLLVTADAAALGAAVALAREHPDLHVVHLARRELAASSPAAARHRTLAGAADVLVTCDDALAAALARRRGSPLRPLVVPPWHLPTAAPAPPPGGIADLLPADVALVAHRGDVHGHEFATLLEVLAGAGPEMHLLALGAPEDLWIAHERAHARGLVGRVHRLPASGITDPRSLRGRVDLAVVTGPATSSDHLALYGLGVPVGVGPSADPSDGWPLEEASAGAHVHRWADADGLAALVRERPSAVDVASTEAWQALCRRQQARLETVVAAAVGGPGGRRAEASPRSGAAAPRRAFRRLVIGPTNSAGQAWQWAEAVRRRVDDLEAHAVALSGPHYQFRTDTLLDPDDWADEQWQRDHERRVLATTTHVLMEAFQSVLGAGPIHERFLEDVRRLHEADTAAALVMHGSEVRRPSRHRELVGHSPFRPGTELTERLERVTTLMHRLLADFDGARFVTTLDLLDHVPDATWLPVTVDAGRFRPTPLGLGRRRPVVMAMPTSSPLKGGDVADEVCRRLESEGLLTYRHVAAVSHSEVPGLMAAADVVVDGIVLGTYGVTSVEAMASGRVVLADTGRVAHRLADDLPVVATTPETLEHRLRELCDRPGEFAERGAAGPDWVARHHDGTMAAHVLAEWLTG